MKRLTMMILAGAALAAAQSPALGAEPLGQASPTPPPATEPAAAYSEIVRGELVKIEGNYYVVRDDAGKEIRLHYGSDTELVGEVEPGDQIEVRASPVEHAMFIKPAAFAEPAAGAPTRTVIGELVKIEGPYYVVKDKAGREIRLQVSRDTELAGAFRPGDRIEAQIAPLEHAMSVKRAH
jgi:uncharacterized protein YdeI (BOF family)